MQIFIVSNLGICEAADSRVARGEFHVMQAYGPKQLECIQDAVTIAKCTGSVGATHSISKDGEVHSSARVERVREPLTLIETITEER